MKSHQIILLLCYCFLSYDYYCFLLLEEDSILFNSNLKDKDRNVHVFLFLSGWEREGRRKRNVLLKNKIWKNLLVARPLKKDYFAAPILVLENIFLKNEKSSNYFVIVLLFLIIWL